MKQKQESIRFYFIILSRKIRTPVLIALFFCLVAQPQSLRAQFNFYSNIHCSAGNGCSVEDLIFISRDTAIRVGNVFIDPTHYYYFVSRSYNQAMSFSQIYQSNVPAWCSKVYDGKNNFVIVHHSAGLLKVRILDGTSQWNYCNSSGYSFQDLSSPDSLHHFILSLMQGVNHSSRISKCDGVTNMFLDTVFAIDAVNILFPDTLHGYILGADTITGRNSTILTSYQGGVDWQVSFQDTSCNFTQLFMVTPYVGYACGDSGKVIKTTDGGISWQQVNINTPKQLYRIAFQDDTMGFAVGDSGFIMKTINGGISWHQEPATTNHHLRRILYVHPRTFYALTSNSDLLYVHYTDSVDGNWEIYSLDKEGLIPYPNPSDGNCTVRIPELLRKDKTSTLKLYNYIGILIKEWPIENQISELNLSLEKISNGIYSLVLTGSAFRACAKITIQ